MPYGDKAVDLLDGILHDKHQQYVSLSVIVSVDAERTPITAFTKHQNSPASNLLHSK